MVLRKTVVRKVKKSLRVPKRKSAKKSNPKNYRSRYKSTVKSVKSKSKLKTKSKSSNRGKSDYQLFVKKHMKDPKIQKLPVTERMREIAKLWKKLQI